MTDVLDTPGAPGRPEPAPESGPDRPRLRSAAAEFRAFSRTDRGRRIVIGSGGVLTLVVLLWALTFGGSAVDIGDALGALQAKLTFTPPADAATARTYLQVWELRVPRVLLSLVAGAALAIAGVLFQGLLRNPLVSPYTLGIAPAAAFGASYAIVFIGAETGGLSSSAWVVVGALTVSVASSVFVLALAAAKRSDPSTLILLGIAVTQFFTAATSALQFTADQETLALIVQWTWGSVNGAVWSQVLMVAALFLAVYPFVQRKSGALNAIAFAGDDAAKSLGVPVTSTRLSLIGLAVVLTAVTISFTGIIGFVGLVAPHIARLLIGSNHRFLLPFSAVVGGLLLVVADSVGRTVLNPAVIPVGIVDALIGAPVFLYLILAKRRAAS
ncbi:FecCD family ABC transporter permease [Rhodococcus aetherivorans]